jgi:hypothetical protein
VREVGNGVDRETRRTRNNRGRCEGPRAGRGVRALRARRTSCGDGKGRVHVVRVIVVRVPVQVNPVVFFAGVICNGRHEDESERKRSRGRSVECGGSEGESKTNRKKNEPRVCAYAKRSRAARSSRQTRYRVICGPSWLDLGSNISGNLLTSLQAQWHQSTLAHATDVILAGTLPGRQLSITSE